MVNLFFFYEASSPWELDRITFLQNRNAKDCKNSRYGAKQALSLKVNYLQEVTSQSLSKAFSIRHICGYFICGAFLTPWRNLGLMVSFVNVLCLGCLEQS